MNAKPLLAALTLALAMPASALADHRLAERAALGAAIGGAVGAYAGAELGGRDGAVLGGALGGAVGTRMATERYSSRHRHVSRDPHRYDPYTTRRSHDTRRVTVYEHHHYDRRGKRNHRSGPPARHFCPPGLARQGRC